MQKRLAVVLMTALILTVVGCGANDAGTSNEEPVTTNEESSVADNATEVTDTTEDTEVEKKGTTFANATFSCTLPKGFIADKETEGMYITKNYPTDTSTINYIIAEGDEGIADMDQKTYEESLEEDFLNEYGDTVDVTISEFDNLLISECNALRIKMSYEIKGTTYEQLMYMIDNGTETHIFTYTQEQGGKWMELFEQSGDTITIQK